MPKVDQPFETPPQSLRKGHLTCSLTKNGELTRRRAEASG